MTVNAQRSGPTVASKTLGVLGGMDPAATAEFLRLLSAWAPAKSDQEHPRVLLLSDPRIPDRSTAVLSGNGDPTPRLKDGLLMLADCGANLLALVCNTAHVFIDRFQEDLPVPLVHIVEATLGEAQRRSPEGGWLVATSGTRATGIYQDRAKRLGCPLCVPDDEVQDAIQQVIALVKTNRVAEAKEWMRAVLQSLWNQSSLPIVAACTEVPLAYPNESPPQRMVSSLEALAIRCLREL